jgi:thiol:disulfide interchange protein DsbA
MKKILSLAFISIGLLFFSGVNAAEKYQLISPPQNTSTGGKVEVLEFFWYGCPHCNTLEPTMKKWVEDKPDYVELVRVAPPLNPAWSNHGRAFYAAQILGELDRFHEPMFDALHKERKRLNTVEEIAEFAGSLGIDKEKFLATMNSFAVETKLMRARQQAIAMGLTGVPALVVNGKFRTSASLAGGNEQMMDLVNSLADQENSK